MPYAAESDLDAKWGAEQVTLAAWNATTSARDEGRITVALAAAGAVMDGYFARRYALPLNPSADGALLLTNLACDLAMGQLSNTPGTRNEIVAEAEKRAIQFLRDVGDGKAAVPVVAPNALATIAPNEPVMIADNRMFTRNRMRAL